jgi:hypothetical protein
MRRCLRIIVQRSWTARADSAETADFGQVGLIGRVTDIGEAPRYHSLRTLVAPDGILPATQIETDRTGRLVAAIAVGRARIVVCFT